MAATISFNCPECKAQLRGPAEMQGKKARCKRCGHTFVLKAAGSPPAAGPSPRAGTPAKPAAPAAKAKPSAKAAPEPAPAPKKPADSDHDDGQVMYNFVEETPAETPAKPAEPATPTQPKGGRKYEDIDHNPYAITTLDLTPRCPFCAQEMESKEAIICLHCGYNTQTRTHAVIVRTYANTFMDRFMWLLPGILCVVAIMILAGCIIYLWTALPNPDDPKEKEGLGAYWIRPAQVWGTVAAGFMIFFAGMFAVYRLILHPAPPEVEKK
jgi:DNA-directed RNA polymerase subunit RPC12/RpoP